jgi:hypothetical protein
MVLPNTPLYRREVEAAVLAKATSVPHYAVVVFTWTPLDDLIRMADRLPVGSTRESRFRPVPCLELPNGSVVHFTRDQDQQRWLGATLDWVVAGLGWPVDLMVMATRLIGTDDAGRPRDTRITLLLNDCWGYILPRRWDGAEALTWES